MQCHIGLPELIPLSYFYPLALQIIFHHMCASSPIHSISPTRDHFILLFIILFIILFFLVLIMPKTSPTPLPPSAGFVGFLYNKEKGEVLGRTGTSWAKIGLFYVIY